MGADVSIRVRSVIVRIQIERTCIQSIVPIPTEIEYLRIVDIRIIWPVRIEWLSVTQIILM